MDSASISVLKHDSTVVVAKSSPVSRLPAQAIAVRGQLSRLVATTRDEDGVALRC